MERVVVPKGVKSIGAGAFSRGYFSELILPEGLESIGNDAFFACENLKSVRFPFTLKSIGDSAFARCTRLEKAEFPEGLEIIGKGAFSECGFYKIFLPKSIREIGAWAFSKSIYLPSLLQIYCEDEPKQGWTDKFVVTEIFRSVPDPESEGFNFHRSSGGWDSHKEKVGEKTERILWYSGADLHCHASYEEYERDILK